MRRDRASTQAWSRLGLVGADAAKRQAAGIAHTEFEGIYRQKGTWLKAVVNNWVCEHPNKATRAVYNAMKKADLQRIVDSRGAVQSSYLNLFKNVPNYYFKCYDYYQAMLNSDVMLATDCDSDLRNMAGTFGQQVNKSGWMPLQAYHICSSLTLISLILLQMQKASSAVKAATALIAMPGPGTKAEAADVLYIEEAVNLRVGLGQLHHVMDTLVGA